MNRLILVWFKNYGSIRLDSRFRGNDEATHAKPAKTGKLKHDQYIISSTLDRFSTNPLSAFSTSFFRVVSSNHFRVVQAKMRKSEISFIMPPFFRTGQLLFRYLCLLRQESYCHRDCSSSDIRSLHVGRR